MEDASSTQAGIGNSGVYLLVNNAWFSCIITPLGVEQMVIGSFTSVPPIDLARNDKRVSSFKNRHLKDQDKIIER